jgi:hypothetical protein
MPTREEMIAHLERQNMIKHLQAKDAAKALGTPQGPNVKDEMPDWLGDSRTVVKNLTDTPEQAITYLQKKHPEAEFEKNGDDIIARKRGEKDWGKLDPSFSPFSNPIGTAKDMWHDTKDIGYDVAQGLAEAGGATIGGIAGSAAPVVGTMAGAAAGGAAATAAVSSAREKLAEMLGVREADYTNAGKDAALSAVMPYAFKYAGKAVKAGGRQIPKLYAAGLGTAPEVLQTIAKKGPQLDDLARDGVTGLLDDTGREVNKALTGQKQKAVDLINAARGSGAMVETRSAKQKLLDAMAGEQAHINGGNGSQLAKDRLKALTEASDYAFNGVADELPVGHALDLQQMLNDEFGDYGKGMISQAKRAGMGNGQDALVSRAGMGSSQALNEAMDIASNGWTQEGKDAYRQYLKQVKEAAPAFKDASAVESTFNKVGKGSKRVFNESIDSIDHMTGGKVRDNMNLYAAHNYLNPTSAKGLQGVADQVAGNAPLQKILSMAGATGGYLTGMGYAGAAGGGFAGKKLGGILTSPGAIKKFVAAQNLTEAGAEKLMKALSDNPALLNSIYGGASSLGSEIRR